MARVIILFLAIVSAPGFAQQKTSIARPRTSDLGLKVGILPLGPLNGITDVAGVRVGHTTIVRGDNIRTGVTAILPHAGNLYREKVPGAVGVLVQTNFGGVLPIAGVPVGFELRQYYLRQELQQAGSGADHGNGSCMMVVATDAPMDARNLKRLAARTLLGLARTGSAASNGSGDYAIAFSTAPQVRIHGADSSMTRHVELINNDAISPLFLAAIEATEEAIYNSMFRASSTTGNGHTADALPIDKTLDIKKVQNHPVITP